MESFSEVKDKLNSGTSEECSEIIGHSQLPNMPAVAAV
jgi:hypothetical protein